MIDFGIASYVDDRVEDPCEIGTLIFMAPELLGDIDGEFESTARDIWALGVAVMREV